MSTQAPVRPAAERSTEEGRPGRSAGFRGVPAALLVVGAAVACATVAVGVGTSVGAVGALGLGVAAVGATLLVRLPLRWWPALLLLVTVAAPAGALPLPGFRGNNGSFSPALLLVPLWLLAEMRAGWSWRGVGTSRRAVQVLSVVVAAVLTVETFLSPELRTSGGWAVTFLATTVLVPVVLRPAAARTLVSTWVVLGGVLGAYAVLEAFVLHTNPLWGWSGSSGGGRAFASFGYPLAAASFFVGATVLATGRWVRSPTAAGAALLVGAAAGLAACGSRGALIAGAAGVVLVLLSSVAGAVRSSGGGAARGAGRPWAVVGVLVVLAVVVLVGLGQRTAAGGEEGSTIVRQRSLETGLFIAGRTGLLGQGPGMAYSVKTSTSGPGTDEARSIENAWLELYVGVGPLGCAAFGALVLACSAVGLRRRRWDAVALVLALLVAYLFYNALEASKPLTTLLLGLGLGLCVVRADPSPVMPETCAARAAAP